MGSLDWRSLGSHLQKHWHKARTGSREELREKYLQWKVAMATKGYSSLDLRGKAKIRGALRSCAAAGPWETSGPLSPPFSRLCVQATVALTAHVAKASAMDHESPALYFSITAIPYNRFFSGFLFLSHSVFF